MTPTPEKWEKEIDDWFGDGAENGLTRGRLDIQEVKSFIAKQITQAKEESKKGESWRRGYMAGIEEERQRIKEEIEGMLVPCIGNPEMMQPFEDRIRNTALSDILKALEPDTSSTENAFDKQLTLEKEAGSSWSEKERKFLLEDY